MPIEIRYNKQKINLNTEDSKYIDKNKFLTKNDLYFYINKFRIKRDLSNIEELQIIALTKEDFLEKCLLAISKYII